MAARPDVRSVTASVKAAYHANLVGARRAYSAGAITLAFLAVGFMLLWMLAGGHVAHGILFAGALFLTFISLRADVRSLYAGDALVLWVRRFGRDRGATRSFARLLNDAVRGMAVPVTIQDTTIRSSVAIASSRLFAGSVSRASSNLVIFVFGGLWFVLEFLREEYPLPVLVTAAVALLVLTAFGLLRRAGYFRVTASTPGRNSSDVLRRVRERHVAPTLLDSFVSCLSRTNTVPACVHRLVRASCDGWFGRASYH